jgi:hypothetical protein
MALGDTSLPVPGRRGDADQRGGARAQEANAENLAHLLATVEKRGY